LFVDHESWQASALLLMSGVVLVGSGFFYTFLIIIVLYGLLISIHV
jgi:hypothetical protein